MRRIHALLAILLAATFCLLSTPVAAQDSENGEGVYLPIISNVSRPINPWPSNWMFSVSPNTWLTWDFSGIDRLNARYDIYLDDSNPADTLVATDVQGLFYELPTLKSGWRYYWQVVAHLPNGTTIAGPQWTFRTEVADAPLNLEAMISIPEGNLQMGCDETNDGGYGCRPRELPLHTVWVDAFEIDKYEVTNQQYQECVNDGGCHAPRFSKSLTRPWYYGNPAYAEYPVLYVSWWDARDYCEWTDKRLPTEAEWEMAARGPYDTRPWPWGDETVDCSRANFTDSRNDSRWIVCVGDTTRVGSYPAGASPLGVMDMAGNVFEWVYDAYDENYYKYSPSVNPQGPDTNKGQSAGPAFSIRGGSYRPHWFYPRAFNRHWGHHGEEGVGADAPYYRNNQVGFRCAR